MKDHNAPGFYKELAASPAYRDALVKLSLDPTALSEFQRNPEAFASTIQGMCDDEKSALASGDPVQMHSQMRGTCTSPNRDHVTASKF